MAGNQGFASMDDKKARKIQSMGGKAGGAKSQKSSGTSSRGAAGHTEAAKRGGTNSHRNTTS
ncbi:MAG: general stress protein [Patescibacteria group bacterium]|nr:general stress protein [Patescibacteria group bacterium]